MAVPDRNNLPYTGQSEQGVLNESRDEKYKVLGVELLAENPGGTALNRLKTDATGALAISGEITATADPKVDSIVEVGATYIYSGEALPGTLTSVAEWRISRTTVATLETRWADGVASFTKEWDIKEGYSY